MNEEKKYILDKNTAAKKLQRMAFEIAEQNVGQTDTIILAGVKDYGVTIAQVIAKQLRTIFNGEVKVIEVDFDKRRPDTISLSEQLNFDDATVIVVDDVSNSGKAMLYALKPFIAFHPKKIQALVLVDRSHKAFPVHTDYVGISIATTLQEHIYVEVEGDEVVGAYLV